ncbi:MAG: N-acetyltransferase [Hyphomicrobiaceae bacterium]|nr:N-acetyltransferase [Hyphomicrobiaceae bacterium]
MTYTIRPASSADIPALLDLHNWSIAELDGTWIEKPETLEGRTKWFNDRMAADFPVLVAEDAAGQVVGYASYGTYRGRDGYDLTVEHSIYIYPHAQGHGLGRRFLDMLVDIARERGKHMMVAIIDAQNRISIVLHEKSGFVQGGALPQAGKKKGKWRDQVTLYLLLDDREAPGA